MTPAAFSTRFSAYYALLMIGMGVQLPFLPLWLHARGLAVTEIALILAAAMASRTIGTPLAAFVADRYQNRRFLIRACATSSFLAYSLLVFMHGFWPIFTVAVLAAFLFAPVFPLSETYAVDGATSRGLDYGRIRLWASLSFLAGSLGGGILLEALPADAAAILLALAQGLAMLSTLLIPREMGEMEGAVKRTGAAWPDVRRHLLVPAFLVFLAAVSLTQSSHAMLYTFGSVYWQDLGYSKVMIGLFWTIGVTCEVTFFAFSNVVLARYGAVLLICAGASGGVLRWMLMAQALPFLPMAATQTLHFISFAMTHLGTMHYLRLTIPAEVRNLAQGLYVALSSGVLMSVMAWASGPLYGSLGGGAYYAMAALALASLAFSLMLLRINPRALPAGET